MYRGGTTLKYTAVVSRSLTMCDETIQVVIHDTDSFESFKSRVYSALNMCDTRANRQMFRLFEDTDLTNNLSVSEYVEAKIAASIIYPNSMVEDVNIGKDAQLEFTKINASGEVIKLFVHEVGTGTCDELNTVIEDVWDLLDKRLFITNKRELDFMTYFHSLDPSTKIKISMIMDILYGRAHVEDVVSRLTNPQSLPNGVYIQEVDQHDS
jgi:hypothetical protein